MLILGGGNGIILNELMEKVKGVKVDFVEPSEKFIAIAEKKLKPEFRGRIHFIHGDHRAIPANKTYDCFSTFFVVDCFTEEEAFSFCSNAASHLPSGGMWLFADFISTPNIFHRALIWFMYRFFRVVSGISGNHLPDYYFIFQTLSFKEEASRKFYGGMIESKCLRKN